MSGHVNKKVCFIVHPKATHPQRTKATAISEGMRRHGLRNVVFSDNWSEADLSADLFVTWAWKPTRDTGTARWKHLHNHNMRTGTKTLVMELAYAGDRNHWTSLGFNGLNGRADFANSHITDTSRWYGHFPDLDKPWQKKNTGTVLLIGQVRSDAALDGFNHVSWLRSSIKTLTTQGYSVLFRPHPLDKFDLKEFDQKLKYSIDKNPSIETTLQEVDFVVTFSSNSGVLSCLQGIPTITMDKGAMSWEVTSHSLESPIIMPDKNPWLAKLAYCQWTPEELSRGEAWDHLRHRAFN